MYSFRTSLIIAGMVCTGAARSVGVKLLYQLGFDNYLFVALLYLMGQSLALLVYYCVEPYCCCGRNILEEGSNTEDCEYARINLSEHHGNMTKNGNNGEVDGSSSSDDNSTTDDSSQEVSEVELQPIGSTATSTISVATANEVAHQQLQYEDTSQPIAVLSPPQQSMPSNDNQRWPQTRRGSKTGLTEESQRAVAWIHTIPWQVKPLIPGLFNLANAALKWASFAYVAASIAEIMMAGLELVLSVCVARVVRKRQISSLRWAGVGIVAFGLCVVHTADVFDTTKKQQQQQEANDTNDDAAIQQLQRDNFIGAMLIIGQCVTAVIQDMSEELFLQEADFPATLLLGMEGLYGLLFGLPLYLQFAPESLMTTIRGLEASLWEMGYIGLLTSIFTVTGIFNIMATGVTSSMTRNMWKNCRTILVWGLGLVLYYSLGRKELGEEWVVPDSIFILGGFFIMLSGIFVYYKHR